MGDPNGRAARCVVIIDDSVDAVEALAMLLELEGHRVHAAHDGVAGLALIESMNPDVVLCDIGLPGMSGYEVAQAARRRSPAAVLAAVTGHGQAEDVQRAIAAGFDHHLLKPVDPGAVLALIERVG